MHASKLLCLFVFVAIISLIDASCKITLKVRSSTKKSFQVQVYIPSLHQKTERITFNGHGEKKVHIKGTKCMDKKWIVKTWKKVPNGDWVPAAQSSGKLGGIGSFRVVVEDNLIPYGLDRMGVACSEGDGLCG